jgi:hypothetical protein
MAAPRAVVQPVPQQPVRVAARPAPPPVTVAAAAPATVAPVQSHASTQRADAVLARIVASLTIPASELGVSDPAGEPAPVTTGTSAEGRRVVAGASQKEARDTAVRRVVAARLTGDASADDEAAAATPARRGAKTVEVAALTPAEKRAADRKARAEKQAAADKKAAAEKLAAEKKAARANPERIWVQVASGANVRDLGRAWTAAKAKSPALLGKRPGYTTDFKATNRVLTGPFKTDAEARAFVNKLAKEGVSSFAFTSDAGQQVDRLPAK